MMTPLEDRYPDYAELRRQLQSRRKTDPAKRKARLLRSQQPPRNAGTLAEDAIGPVSDPTPAPGDEKEPTGDLEPFDLDEVDPLEIDLSSGWEWTARVMAANVPTPGRQVEAAREVEVGVLAQAALDGSILRPFAASDRELQAVVTKGQIAMSELLLGNGRLVLHWARRYASGDPDLTEDLFQEGYFGLRRAIQGWDWARGYSFATYASFHIRQAITRARQNSQYVVRIPVYIQDAWGFAKRHGVELSESEQSALQLVQGIQSWEHLVELLPDDAFVLPDSSEGLMHEIAVHAVVDELMGFLDDRSRAALADRFGLFGEPMTLDAIGQVLGVTRERVRQIVSMTVSAIRLRYLSASPELLEAALRAVPEAEQLGLAAVRLLIDPDRMPASRTLEMLGVSKSQARSLRQKLGDSILDLNFDISSLPRLVTRD